MASVGHRTGCLRVILAQPRGFCAGVERAIDTVQAALQKYGAPVYVRHEIVHNRRVVENLKAKGVRFVDHVEEIPSDMVAVFSAHGVSAKVEQDAAARGLRPIDATCPLVSKVHTCPTDGTGHRGSERCFGASARNEPTVPRGGPLLALTHMLLPPPGDHSRLRRRRRWRLAAIPGCQTIRISKPACFLGQSEGVTSDREAHHGTNGWLYCASIEPETAEEQAAWRKASPAGLDAVSPIRRPRAFARALGAMAAQQAGPRGRIVLLRNTVDGRTFCTAHKSQTVYHGPVVNADDPVRRLEAASSDLEAGHPTTALRRGVDRGAVQRSGGVRLVGRGSGSGSTFPVAGSGPVYGTGLPATDPPRRSFAAGWRRGGERRRVPRGDGGRGGRGAAAARGVGPSAAGAPP